MRNVVGVQWANDVIEEWRKHGRWMKVSKEQEVFRFGDGNTLNSRFRLEIEAGFGGRKVYLAFSVVPGPCPPLLSKQAHTKLGPIIDTEDHTFSSRKLRIKNYGLSETEAGHYTVRIDEFDQIGAEQRLETHEGESKMSLDEEVALCMDGTYVTETCGSKGMSHSNSCDQDRHVSCLESSTLSPMREFGASDSRIPRDVRGRGRVDAVSPESTATTSPDGRSSPNAGNARKCSQDSPSQHGDDHRLVRFSDFPSPNLHGSAHWKQRNEAALGSYRWTI